jgi:hypothetical protein
MSGWLHRGNFVGSELVRLLLLELKRRRLCAEGEGDGTVRKQVYVSGHGGRG